MNDRMLTRAARKHTVSRVGYEPRP